MEYSSAPHGFPTLPPPPSHTVGIMVRSRSMEPSVQHAVLAPTRFTSRTYTHWPFESYRPQQFYRVTCAKLFNIQYTLIPGERERARTCLRAFFHAKVYRAIMSCGASAIIVKRRESFYQHMPADSFSACTRRRMMHPFIAWMKRKGPTLPSAVHPGRLTTHTHTMDTDPFRIKVGLGPTGQQLSAQFIGPYNHCLCRVKAEPSLRSWLCCAVACYILHFGLNPSCKIVLAGFNNLCRIRHPDGCNMPNSQMTKFFIKDECHRHFKFNLGSKLLKPRLSDSHFCNLLSRKV
jgi:hypothetical protein